MVWILFGLASAAGAWLRHVVSSAIPSVWGTLIANWLGCFVLALIVGWSEQSPLERGPHLFWIGTGFCGAFTTYSTFNLELLRAGRQSTGLAIGYLLATLLGGLVIGAIGLRIGSPS